jgi:hypothetical protein
VTLDELSERLNGIRRTGRGVNARCPAHADRRASLSVAEGRDGRVLIRCFAGCETETILAALNLKWADLFADGKRQQVRMSEFGHPETLGKTTTFVCELDAVRADLLGRERRHAERRERWAHVMELADEAREIDRLVRQARHVVTDDDAGWDLEAKATDLERMMLNAEAGAHAEVAGRCLW